MRVTIPMLTVLALLTVLAGVAAGQPARLGNGPIIDARPRRAARPRPRHRAPGRPTPHVARLHAADDRRRPQHVRYWNDGRDTQPPATSVAARARRLLLRHVPRSRRSRSRASAPSRRTARSMPAARPVHWFTGVSVQRQCQLHEALMARTGERRLNDGAMAALVLHAGAEAVTAHRPGAHRRHAAHARPGALLARAARRPEGAPAPSPPRSRTIPTPK